MVGVPPHLQQQFLHLISLSRDSSFIPGPTIYHTPGHSSSAWIVLGCILTSPGWRRAYAQQISWSQKPARPASVVFLSEHLTHLHLK